MNRNTATTRAVAYLRVSTAQQADHGVSLAAQRAKVGEGVIPRAGPRDDRWVPRIPTRAASQHGRRREDPSSGRRHACVAVPGAKTLNFLMVTRRLGTVDVILYRRLISLVD